MGAADVVQFLGGWDRVRVQVELGCGRWGLEDLNICIDDISIAIQVDW